MAEVADLLKLSELQRQNAALKKARALRESYGLHFYRPHWKQHLFHTTVANARYLRTGNRFGKSECGICEDIAWCLGGRLWYRSSFEIKDGEGNVKFKNEGSANNPLVTKGLPGRPVKGLILVVDWDKAKEIFTSRDGSFNTWGKLWRFLPKDAIGKITTGGRVDQIVKIEIKRPAEFGGGSSTLTFDTIESYKRNRMGAESSDWDFIHIDEPCPESMFQAHARGLMDRGGKYWFTCTPLDEMWINDLFVPPGRTTIDDAKAGLEFLSKEGLSRYIITGDTFDNPYVSEAGRLEFSASLTEEEKACRLNGIPLALAGSVYKEFKHDEHVLREVPKGWKSFFEPPEDYTIRVAWDVHGSRVPQAVLFSATAPDGTVFIYDELFCESLIGANAKLVAEKLKNRFVMNYWIDPRAMIVNPVTGTADVAEAIGAEGLYFEPASKDLTTGISTVKEKLLERKLGRPTIYFSPGLKETLYEFSRYVYDLDKNKPKDKDDHMMENLYRLVLGGLDYVQPPRPEDYIARPQMGVRFNEDQMAFA